EEERVVRGVCPACTTLLDGQQRSIGVEEGKCRAQAAADPLRIQLRLDLPEVPRRERELVKRCVVPTPGEIKVARNAHNLRTNDRLIECVLKPHPWLADREGGKRLVLGEVP